MNEKRYVVKEQSLKNLADQVRIKAGTPDTLYDIDDMSAAISTLGMPELEELNVTENGEYTPTTYGYSRVTVDVQPPREEINITENGEYTPTSYGYSKVTVDVQPTLEELTVTENGIYTPTEYGYSKVTVNCPPGPPESALKITGNCTNKFSYDGWNWFINSYGDKITTENITDASNMFVSNPIERIPFTINTTDSCNLSYMFSNCRHLLELPVITNLRPYGDIFNGCNELVSVNNNQFIVKNSSISLNELFSGCHRLRSIGNMLDNLPDTVKGNSIFGLYNTFSSCYSMDEIVNLPFVYSTYGGSYTFDGCVTYCHRLKKLTFRNQVVPTTEKLKAATLSLTDYVGYAYGTNFDALHDAGFTEELQVTDDASYQALKNNPDWWTTASAYSRYNHDSAVDTINSLPDITATGVTNTIKFKGAAGSKTDGGAISSLTPEEIAVATAKGWTVTLV